MTQKSLIIRDVTCYVVAGVEANEWTPLSATPLGYSGNITAHKDNTVDIDIRVVGETDQSTMSPGEYNYFDSVDLSKIEVKDNGIAGSIIKVVGSR